MASSFQFLWTSSSLPAQAGHILAEFLSERFVIMLHCLLRSISIQFLFSNLSKVRPGFRDLMHFSLPSQKRVEVRRELQAPFALLSVSLISLYAHVDASLFEACGVLLPRSIITLKLADSWRIEIKGRSTTIEHYLPSLVIFHQSVMFVSTWEIPR